MIQFVLTQLHEGDMIQSITLLVWGCRRLLIQVQVVQNRHTRNLCTELFPTHDRDLFDTHHIPRRETFGVLLSHQTGDPTNQVRHVIQFIIPPCDDLWRVILPPVHELGDEFILTITVHKSDILLINLCGTRSKGSNLFSIIILNCNQ